MPMAIDDETPTGGVPPGQVALVLCFDGTGNQFQANEGDTNIVKIYQMLEKHTPGQYHYYQPGIGTYSKGSSRSQGSFHPLAKLGKKIYSSVDEGVGLSFVDHVLGGYEFIMRYYQKHNDIYIFGFSRGAYTARFLAEMIQNIGLLAKGNEEMVDFAWETFSKFQQVRGNVNKSAKDQEIIDYMDDFRRTFCRPWVPVHFLGLFDCVNSVGQFEIPLFRKSYEYMAMPAAKHIRHAVSIHERRLKFKPALFLFPPEAKVDCKEVWFAGNHADVGGGWRWAKDGPDHLLSDTPLNWMVQEALNLKDSESKLVFKPENLKKVRVGERSFLEPPAVRSEDDLEARKKASRPHDMLRFGGGVGWFSVIVWWIMESLPFFTRLELEHGAWVPRYWPPNLGAPRDIPQDAVIHESVEEMVKDGILPEMPQRGGDNSHLENTFRYFKSWRTTKPTGLSANSINGTSQHDETSPLLKKDTNGTRPS